jgi:hypothetical protein
MVDVDSLPSLDPIEVSFGAGGIALIDRNELEAAQRGYSFREAPADLCGVKDGDWREEWIVIGHTTDLGDPIFIDAAKKDFPVYTAAHGTGAWAPELVSRTYSGFRQIMVLFEEVALSREHPVGLSDNPMTIAEYKIFVEQAQEIGQLDDPFFWALIVADEEAGIGPEI